MSTESESQLSPLSIDWSDISGYGDFELLYRGSYADAYRARKAGKYFLLKALHDADPTYLPLLRREYEIHIGLQHPCIVETVTFDNIDTLGPCIVMEYVDGMTLQEYIRTKPGYRALRKALFQLLDALAYIHGKGIIHNDIKPANILIDRLTHDVRLIDFGLSDDQAHYLITTPGCTREYASPELQSRSTDIDCRSDIYSVGKILPLMFRHCYRHIARKCSRPNRKVRYRDIPQLTRRLKWRDKWPWLAVAAMSVMALSYLAVPRVVEEKQELQYQEAVQNHDDQLRERADSCFNALYLQILTRIENSPSEIAAYSEMPGFARGFVNLRDSTLLQFENQSNSENFYSHTEMLYNSMNGKLYSIIDSIYNSR